VVAGARGDHAEPVAREIEASGGTAAAVTLDVTEPASIVGMTQTALDRFDEAAVTLTRCAEDPPLSDEQEHFIARCEGAR